jgi:hypothetical protein
MWEMRNICKVLVGKPERKRPLGLPRLRWENIIVDLKSISGGGGGGGCGMDLCCSG